MNIKFIAFLLILVLVKGANATSSSIEEDFLNFFQSNTSNPQKMLHSVQKDDFEGKNYAFHCAHQESYRICIQDPKYPRYVPIGSISVKSLSPCVDDYFLTAEWLIADNPTPGINTTFIMNFIVSAKTKENTVEFVEQKDSFVGSSKKGELNIESSCGFP